MGLDIEALTESFALVAEQETALASRFYEILFERYPQTRAMFGPRVAQQAKMLTQALAAVVEHLEDSAWLGTTLHALGAKHVEYGVRDEMYDWVGECLIAALAEIAGPAFTPRVKDAWIAAYGAIAELMKRGAASVTVAPPQPRPIGSTRPAHQPSSSP
jgi:hemoglobin-like flavoprotein